MVHLQQAAKMSIRNKKMALPIISLVAIACYSQLLPTRANRIGFCGPAGPSLLDAIKRSWDSSEPKSDDTPMVSVGIGVDGRLYNAVMDRYSANEQFNAECLEAVCGASPVTPTGFHSGNLEPATLRFSAKENPPRFEGQDIKDYLSKHPQPEGEMSKFVVVHKIPLDVLRRYPGLFSEKELLSESNLQEIHIGITSPVDKDGNRRNKPTYIDLINNHFGFWADLFLKNPRITRHEILEEAKHIPPI